MTGECQLCGVTGDVAVGLVRWANPPADASPFASLARCRDRAGCRRRHVGDWPVVDGDVSGKADADKVRASVAARRADA